MCRSRATLSVRRSFVKLSYVAIRQRQQAAQKVHRTGVLVRVRYQWLNKTRGGINAGSAALCLTGSINRSRPTKKTSADCGEPTRDESKFVKSSRHPYSKLSGAPQRRPLSFDRPDYANRVARAIPRARRPPSSQRRRLPWPFFFFLLFLDITRSRPRCGRPNRRLLRTLIRDGEVALHRDERTRFGRKVTKRNCAEKLCRRCCCVVRGLTLKPTCAVRFTA